MLLSWSAGRSLSRELLARELAACLEGTRQLLLVLVDVRARQGTTLNVRAGTRWAERTLLLLWSEWSSRRTL